MLLSDLTVNVFYWLLIQMRILDIGITNKMFYCQISERTIMQWDTLKGWLKVRGDSNVNTAVRFNSYSIGSLARDSVNVVTYRYVFPAWGRIIDSEQHIALNSNYINKSCPVRWWIPVRIMDSGRYNTLLSGHGTYLIRLLYPLKTCLYWPSVVVLLSKCQYYATLAYDYILHVCYFLQLLNRTVVTKT